MPTTIFRVTFAEEFRHHLSLMHGWLPIVIQAVAVVVLLVAIGRRSTRWVAIWTPVAVVAGVAAATAAYWFIASQGFSDNPAPMLLWIWVALTAVSAVALLAGWGGSRWWRRGMLATAVPLSLVCAALAVNLWTGYFPTVQVAWNQLSAGPLPDQTDQVAIVAMQKAGKVPPEGSVVTVDTGNAASGFRHRGELVYLPPVWFASNPAPKLPTVMMLGGEFNTPADWLRAGNAISTMDDFAAAHHGNAPVLVFADAGGSFNKDTECVNGTPGKSADHLTKDVVPFMVSHFGVSADPANWGIVGWSMGGTCAVDLAVMHPEEFTSFVDIAGDQSPNTGSKSQTISRLFGGNADAWSAFDPTTVMNNHGPYRGVAGWFDVNGTENGTPTHNDQATAAESLCATGAANGIQCAVVAQPGKHDWPFAHHAFESSLPWLAAQVGTPGVAPVSLPTAPTAAFVQTAAR